MAFAQRLASFWNHPAGPKTIHFWAPTFKVGVETALFAILHNQPYAVGYLASQRCRLSAPPRQDFLPPADCSDSNWGHLVTLFHPNHTGVLCCCSYYRLSCHQQVNYNLLAVNAFMAITGIYQLQRKIAFDMQEKPAQAV